MREQTKYSSVSKLNSLNIFMREQEDTVSMYVHAANRLTQKETFGLSLFLSVQEAEVVRLSIHQFLPSGINSTFSTCLAPLIGKYQM